MPFLEYKDIIEEGDFVLAFISRNDIKPITVVKGESLNTRYGHFEHDKMIGLRYGSQMPGAKGYGFIHLLHPTPEMWTISLPHRTQIVYTCDSSYIIQRLNVTCGSRVIEAGTGSASFTHSFARTLGKQGKLFTYEFHEPRYLEAKKELQQHNLINTLITHRDVCEDGFEIENIPAEFALDIKGEAVFLDLPSPWTAIPHLDKVINQDVKVGICCFSPCIEQVDKTVHALEENGWTQIEMVEVAGRRWEARKDMVRDVKDVVTKLKDIQSRKSQGIESRRTAKLQQKDAAKAADANAESNKRDLESPDPAEPAKKFQNISQGFNPWGKGMRVREGDDGFEWRDVTKIESEIKTHTSYLTFAFKVGTKKIE